MGWGDRGVPARIHSPGAVPTLTQWVGPEMLTHRQAASRATRGVHRPQPLPADLVVPTCCQPGSAASWIHTSLSPETWLSPCCCAGSPGWGRPSAVPMDTSWRLPWPLSAPSCSHGRCCRAPVLPCPGAGHRDGSAAAAEYPVPSTHLPGALLREQPSPSCASHGCPLPTPWSRGCAWGRDGHCSLQPRHRSVLHEPRPVLTCRNGCAAPCGLPRSPRHTQTRPLSCSKGLQRAPESC